ncbi:MAG: DUF1428 domain-containing protein [Pseudomonadales bacterium]|nr:DUF1428 domain-containing protein [Pseudomonadales bacterium]
MSYVDGFVVAVPTANKAMYKEVAEISAQVFKEHGVLRVVECWGDDVPDGELTSFRKAVQVRDDETVCFAWMLWPSKEARNTAMPKLMKDPRLQPDQLPMPFDGNRMIYGGFKVFVDV